PPIGGERRADTGARGNAPSREGGGSARSSPRQGRHGTTRPRAPGIATEDAEYTEGHRCHLGVVSASSVSSVAIQGEGSRASNHGASLPSEREPKPEECSADRDSWGILFSVRTLPATASPEDSMLARKRPLLVAAVLAALAL